MQRSNYFNFNTIHLYLQFHFNYEISSTFLVFCYHILTEDILENIQDNKNAYLSIFTVSDAMHITKIIINT